MDIGPASEKIGKRIDLSAFAVSGKNMSPSIPLQNSSYISCTRDHPWPTIPATTDNTAKPTPMRPSPTMKPAATGMPTSSL
jgi:hypothetical protein